MSSRFYSKRQTKKRPKKGEGMPVKPKAFKSEAAARKWADENGFKSAKVDKITDSKFKLRMHS